MKERNTPDALTEREIVSYLGEAAKGLEVRVFETLASTNTYAKQNADQTQPGRMLVAARSQTGGRGRMGRSFFSPAHSGVYFSIATPVPSLPEALALTSAAAVAVRRAVASLTGKTLGIKWVNDLFLDGKKVSGILCESVPLSGGFCVVVGIGINLRSSGFPPELSGIAGTLEEDTLPRAALIGEVYKELLPYLDDPRDRSWLEEYRTGSTVLGRHVNWRDGDAWHSGVAREIDRDGALIAEDEDGRTVRLCTGEITLRLSERD